MPTLYHQNPSHPTVLLGLQRVWQGVCIRLHVHTTHLWWGHGFHLPPTWFKTHPPANIRFGRNEGGINPSNSRIQRLDSGATPYLLRNSRGPRPQNMSRIQFQNPTIGFWNKTIVSAALIGFHPFLPFRGFYGCLIGYPHPSVMLPSNSWNLLQPLIYQ